MSDSLRDPQISIHVSQWEKVQDRLLRLEEIVTKAGLAQGLFGACPHCGAAIDPRHTYHYSECPDWRP